MMRQQIFTLLVSAALAVGCQQPPAAEKVPDCGKSGCHALPTLHTPISAAPPREHAAARGEGLIRKPVLMPSSSRAFKFIYPRRGHHPEELTRGKCLSCHPVSSEGIRHGISQYPAASRKLAFKGGTSCAASCHSWLKASVTSTGFVPASGKAPVYKGSLRPHDLLTAGAKGGHGKIYASGYVKPEKADILMGRLRPGCVGCHGTRNDKHGSIPGCMDCHKFGGVSGAVHLKHVTAISKGRAALDSGNAKESGCNYCHQLEKPTKLKNAACYNCHLSGHQVVDPKTGKPHFWSM